MSAEQIKVYVTEAVKKIYIFLFPTVVKKRAAYKKRSGPEIFGEYGTIKSLLHDLDDCFMRLKKISKGIKSDNIQRVIKSYGPHVTNMVGDSGDGVYTNQLEGFKAYGLPSFLISYFHHKGDRVQHFHAAIKTKRADFGQRKPGHVYYDVGLTITDDCCSDINKGKPFSIGYCIEVNKTTGEVAALPYKTTNISRALARDSSRKNGSRYHYIPSKTWEYPDHISDEDNQYSQDEIKENLAAKFCLHYGMVMKRESGINIIVKKGKSRATFNVPHNDWKYFFKDRMKVKTVNGNTKPIYHAVKSHFRDTSNKVVPIKTHYRGTRHFYWNGYEIKIVMQGKDGRSQASMDITAVDDTEKSTGKTIELTKASDKLNTLFEGTG